MLSIKGIIEQQLNVARENIAKNMIAQNRKASGNAIAKMRVEATEQQGQLIDGSGYIFSTEYGSRPSTKTDKPPKGMVDSIQKWTLIKGIIAADGNQRGLAYAISTKIIREGNLLFRQGGNSGVITSAVNQKWLSDTAQLIGANFAALIKSETIRNTTSTVV